MTDSIPPTGLYWVKEVVKTYRGLISVRSGDSIICYDFLTFPEDGHPKDSLLTNKRDKRMKSLENFGGTQIRIYFPTGPSTAKHKSLFFSSNLYRLGREISRKYVHLFLKRTSSQAADKDSCKLVDWLAGHIEEIQKVKLSNKGENKTLVVDCDGWELVEEKALKPFFLLIVELMRVQDRNFSVVIVNEKGVLKRIGTYLTQVANTATGALKEKPLLAFDENFKMSIHGGLSDQEVQLLEEILHSLIMEKTYLDFALRKEFLKKNEHLIAFNHFTKTFHPLFSVEKVKNLVRESIRKKLRSIILNPENNIYRSKDCFLIPSGAYSEGYFELHRLFKQESWRREIIRWLRYHIEDLRLSNLVSLGRGANSLGEDIVKIVKGVSHINIPDPRNPIQSFRLNLLLKGGRTAMLTDVIGTQRSLDMVLMFCINLDVQAIFAVVDARTGGKEKSIKSNETEYRLESILKNPIQFWFEGKPGHYKYEEIIRVDPISNAPITEPFLLEKPIWMEMDERTGENQFLDRALSETNGIVIGHFESTERHILYLFLTPVIAQKYGGFIADKIYRDVQRYKDRVLILSDEASISHIFYPQHTPGADEIARQISIIIGGCHVVGLTPKEISYPLSYHPSEKNLGNVIIFDDASSTGYNVRQMIEVIERNGARSIFVYILCNRANRSVSRALQQIQHYGRSAVHVRYLCELPIPAFSEIDCPVCKTLGVLERLKSELKDLKELVYVINKEIYALQKQPIDLVLNPKTVTPYVSTPLDDRLIQTDLRAQLELARTSLPIRHQLAELVKQYESDHKKVLLFFATIAREEFYLLKDSTVFTEVFYDSFKQSIINACKYFIEIISDLSEEQAITVISIFRIFDPDSLLEYLDKVAKDRINENLLLRIVIQLLFSERIRQRAPYVVNILRKWLEDKESELSHHIIQFWENRARPASPPSQEIFHTYMKTYMVLSDSARLANSFAGLEYDKFSSLTFAKIKEVISFWKTATALLEDYILPDLRYIANAQISLVLCKELQEHIVFANSLVYKADELEETLLDQNKGDEIRKTAINGFHAAINKLHKLLLKDDDNTIQRILKSLRTNPCRVAQRVVSQRAAELEKQRIEVEQEIPDDSRLIFGNEIEIYTIVNILLENVITRAFKDIKNSGKKVTKIKIVDDPNEKTVILQILDSGRGVEPNLKFGAGLSTVDYICRKICDDWDIQGVNQKPFKTKAWIKFYAIPKR